VKAEDSMQAINVVHARALQIPTHLEQENNFIKGEVAFYIFTSLSLYPYIDCY
jgi:hypothetical protein